MTISQIGLGLSLGRTPGMTFVNKFGRNAALANGSWEPVTSSGTQWLPTTGNGKTVRVKAGGNAADTADGANAREITVVGVDDSWDTVTETIATAGASASDATTTTFLRVYRAYVSAGGTYGTAAGVGAANAALITLEASDGSADVIEIPAGEGQSQHCSYTVARGYKAILVDAEAEVPSTKTANLRLVIRNGADTASAPFTPPRVVGFRDEVSGSVDKSYPVGQPILGPADIWIEAYGNGVGVAALAEFELVLVEV